MKIHNRFLKTKILLACMTALTVAMPVTAVEDIQVGMNTMRENYHSDNSVISVYALLKSLNLSVDDVVAAPVPWVPDDGKAETGNLNDGIKFLNLPQNGDLKIYTVAGDLVKNMDFENFNDPNGISWNGKNNDGEYVASGVYLWVVKSNSGQKIGKIIVIR